MKQKSSLVQDELNLLEEKLNVELVKLPNVPSDKVPKGRTPEDNEVVSEEGKIPELSANALPHWELAAKYDIIDTRRSARGPRQTPPVSCPKTTVGLA